MSARRTGRCASNTSPRRIPIAFPSAWPTATQAGRILPQAGFATGHWVASTNQRCRSRHLRWFTFPARRRAALQKSKVHTVARSFPLTLTGEFELHRWLPTSCALRRRSFSHRSKRPSTTSKTQSASDWTTSPARLPHITWLASIRIECDDATRRQRHLRSWAMTTLATLRRGVRFSVAANLGDRPGRASARNPANGASRKTCWGTTCELSIGHRRQMRRQSIWIDSYPPPMRMAIYRNYCTATSLAGDVP